MRLIITLPSMRPRNSKRCSASGSSAGASGLGYSLLSDVAANRPTFGSKPCAKRSGFRYISRCCSLNLLLQGGRQGSKGAAPGDGGRPDQRPVERASLDARWCQGTLAGGGSPAAWRCIPHHAQTQTLLLVA